MDLREMSLMPVIALYKMDKPGNYLNMDPRAGQLGVHLTKVENFNYANPQRKDIKVEVCQTYPESLGLIPNNVQNFYFGNDLWGFGCLDENEPIALLGNVDVSNQQTFLEINIYKCD